MLKTINISLTPLVVVQIEAGISVPVWLSVFVLMRTTFTGMENLINSLSLDLVLCIFLLM